MVPPPLVNSIPPASSSLLLSLAASLSHHVPSIPPWLPNAELAVSSSLSRRDSEPHNGKFIAFAVLMPILVILSGVFAGLTLGYMSLDETQLHVLSISGTPYVAPSTSHVLLLTCACI
jgi:metal transporter CNNM